MQEEETISFVGLKYFDAFGREIANNEVNRKEESISLVKDISPTSVTIEANKAPNWNTSDEKHTKYVGFYFDGDTSHLPDFVSLDEYVTIKNNVINFSENLPFILKRQVIPGKTKVVNHFTNVTSSFYLGGSENEYEAGSVSLF